MAQRNTYDLSHYSFMSGKIGRLQTLTNIPVIAGDSFDCQASGILRLSPLKRDLTLDSKVDLFAFYVPYRHIYGDDWTNFIKEGVDESTTFSTGTSIGTGIYCLGVNHLKGVHPYWLMEGYNRIWNRYFRVPSDIGSIIAAGTNLSAQADRLYGKLCARLKCFSTTGLTTTTAAADHTYSADVASNTATIDIIKHAQAQARYSTEQERDWFARRYNDVLDKVFGSSVNIDADERPELVARSSQWLSGYDIDGTDDSTLGTFSGKSAGMVSLRIPRKFFPEHGTLWIMALVRWPTIWEDEIHYLAKKSQPTYKEIAGDPTVLANEPPHELQVQDLFHSTTDASPIGTHPYAQWYRTHPQGVVHWNFEDVQGYPFLKTFPTDHAAARYHRSGDYDEVFQTEKIGHWRTQMRVNLFANRYIPKPTASIFAGTR